MKLPIALALCATTLLACTTRDDDYLLLRRDPGDDVRGRGGALLTLAKANDAEAHYVRQLLASGFGAELLRTYAMTKRYAARTSGYEETPTTIALGVPDAPDPEKERRVQIGWWRTTIDAGAPIIWIDDSPVRRDRSTMADVVTGLARAIVDVISPGGDFPSWKSWSLFDGYVSFLRVVAAEWRPPHTTDDRDELRKLEAFADVRANDAVLRSHGNGHQMVGDPLVVASVLYRLALGLGQQMADPAVYAPFLEVRPPRDVHPALLLGAFRNFQAKLLAAWSRARAAGRPPHDLVDLVEAYVDAYPAERAEATRIFLITTYGATALEDGVEAYPGPEPVESRLATLTADVLFGRRGLRDGLRLPH